MRHVLRRAGETGRLAVLDEATRVSQAAVEAMAPARGANRGSAQAFLEDARAIASDEGAIRGLRWEFFHLTAVVTPCLNMRTIVFGPGEDYDRWLEEARVSLVRRPSDQALFDFFQYGWFGPRARTGSGRLATALRVVFGKSGAAETCGGELGYW